MIDRHSKKVVAIAAAILIAFLFVWYVAHVGGHPNRIGDVNTAFKLIGPDHKIVLESYDDPKVDGITIFVSKAVKGGIKGALGIAQDTSDADIAVRQTGPIHVKDSFDNGDDALTEKRSALFKTLHVSRFWDAPHQTFVYLIWSDKLINGSPKNSISAVVVEGWPDASGQMTAPDLGFLASDKPAP